MCQVRDRIQMGDFQSCIRANSTTRIVWKTQYFYVYYSPNTCITEKEEEAKTKILYVNSLQNFKHIDTQRDSRPHILNE